MRDEVKVIIQPAGEGLFRAIGVEDREGNTTYLGKQAQSGADPEGPERWLRHVALEPIHGASEPLYRLVLQFEEVDPKADNESSQETT